MNRNIRNFMNYVTDNIFKLSYPQILWDTTLGTVSVTVLDWNRNKVTESFDRYFISNNGCEELAFYVTDKILRRFENGEYDKEIEYIF